MATHIESEIDEIEPYDMLNCTHNSLRRAARQLTQVYDDALSPAGLTSSQALLVGQLDALGGKPGQKGPTLQSLAKRLGLQISALTHALKPLQRDGVVAIMADADDRRVKRATLTPAGLAQAQQMYELWRGVNARIETALGVGVAEQLRLLANAVAAPGFAEAMTVTAEPSKD